MSASEALPAKAKRASGAQSPGDDSKSAKDYKQVTVSRKLHDWLFGYAQRHLDDPVQVERGGVTWAMRRAIRLLQEQEAREQYEQ